MQFARSARLALARAAATPLPLRFSSCVAVRSHSRLLHTAAASLQQQQQGPPSSSSSNDAGTPFSHAHPAAPSEPAGDDLSRVDRHMAGTLSASERASFARARVQAERAEAKFRAEQIFEGNKVVDLVRNTRTQHML
jgi:hypothetical protein